LVALAGCSGPAILNSIIPHSGYSIQKDIAYGDDARQKLDIYIPDDVKKPAGVIVFFYGGSWQQGSKADYRFAGQAFASKGYVTVIADYRLYPQVYFPDFVEDGARAVTWVHRHIGQYGGDADNMILAGHSAGAYIAVMLTLNDSYLKAAGGDPLWIKGTAGIAGPYDFLPLTGPKIRAIFSKKPDADTQPITFARAGVPPMLLMAGDADTEVKPKNTYHLAARLKELGDPVTMRIYPDVAHIGIVLALADGFRHKAPVLDDIDRFAQGVMRRGQPQ
jgi:acetyl esterase/lipase